MDELRVLIIDDHALLGESLARFLDSNGMQAQWCSDVTLAMQTIRDQPWSAVLLDLSMPQGSGLDLLKRIKLAHPELPVLILSMHPEQQFALRALRGGAAGYLTKGCSPDVLVEAIHKVVQGGRYLTPGVAEQLANYMNEGAASEAPHARLSDREMQVFMRLVEGKSVNQVADELHISCKTVSTHKTRLMHKLALDNDADLVRYAMHQGIVS
ncbi:response regulator [Thiomonas bhubaneswarensis]|uniref:Two component transcriptional regulator, LuxR family n=1 Tax=Thiomonas bhubaneswarensis TaxID=339866 RepID=A0A0K6HRS0_9BURK|nr:response regulator transcription factor [Thiomonas bhubaneswarensis]CUA93737.1 two component transcriptional regulator, LuxR family [Thiomonas bhubaneswarensis]